MVVFSSSTTVFFIVLKYGLHTDQTFKSDSSDLIIPVSSPVESLSSEIAWKAVYILDLWVSDKRG